jgi:hypothetical protein
MVPASADSSECDMMILLSQPTVGAGRAVP